MDRADIAQRWLDLQVWCREHLGMVRFNKDPERIHARSSLWHLQGETENYYLKIYGDVEAWEREVHAYEQWVPTLGVSAPTLLGVYGSERTGGLYAILISELPGRSLQGIPTRGRALERTAALPVWQAAGGTLRKLHAVTAGESSAGESSANKPCFFGPCRRDGRAAGSSTRDPVEFVTARMTRLRQQADAKGYLDAAELAVVTRALELAFCFDGERPVACHRDFGPDNWIVDDEGRWVGVIDFEMAQWDLRMNDFSRYPNWEWIHSPELLQALYMGYGMRFSAAEKQQCYVLRVQYALDAVVWGMEAKFFGFVEEGRQALAFLSRGELPDFSEPWG